MRLANFFGITPPLTTSPHPPPTISHYKKQTHDLPNSFIHSWIWKLTTLPKIKYFLFFFYMSNSPRLCCYVVGIFHPQQFVKFVPTTLKTFPTFSFTTKMLLPYGNILATPYPPTIFSLDYSTNVPLPP